MLFSDSHILITILFTPLVGAILMLFIPQQSSRSASLDGEHFRISGTGRLAAAHVAFQFRDERAALPIRHRLARGFPRWARTSL